MLYQVQLELSAKREYSFHLIPMLSWTYKTDLKMNDTSREKLKNDLKNSDSDREILKKQVENLTEELTTCGLENNMGCQFN